jgi:hypothetical protein
LSSHAQLYPGIPPHSTSVALAPHATIVPSKSEASKAKGRQKCHVNEPLDGSECEPITNGELFRYYGLAIKSLCFNA